MDKDRVLPFAADSRFFHKRAVRSMDRQDFLTALKHLKRALDMDPGSAEIALDLADTYARMGLYEMSNVELELLLGRQDCPEETQFAIGCNLMAMGDYAQAYVCFSAYLHDHPEGEFAYLAQDGIAQIEESEEEDGIDREQEALAEQGKAALDGGDAERAAEIFERVLAQDPSLLYVRNNLALAYMCLQDSPNAWKQLNRILQTEANNTHACCNAALLMNNEGRADQAAAYNNRRIAAVFLLEKNLGSRVYMLVVPQGEYLRRGAGGYDQRIKFRFQDVFFRKCRTVFTLVLLMKDHINGIVMHNTMLDGGLENHI